MKQHKFLAFLLTHYFALLFFALFCAVSLYQTAFDIYNPPLLIFPLLPYSKFYLLFSNCAGSMPKYDLDIISNLNYLIILKVQFLATYSPIYYFFVILLHQSLTMLSGDQFCELITTITTQLFSGHLTIL